MKKFYTIYIFSLLLSFIGNSAPVAGQTFPQQLTINGTTLDMSSNRTWTLTTTNINEGANLYYSDLRARIALSLTTTGTGAASYNTTTGAWNIPIIAPQINSDWNSVSGLGQVLNKPTIPLDPYTNTAVVAGGAGVSTFYLTSDKTSTGTALYSTITYVNPVVNDVGANYVYGWTISVDKKTLTMTAKSAVPTGTIALLGISILGAPTVVANGTIVSILVKGN